VAANGRPWIEIDFPEDFQRAVREVLPAIERHHAAPAEDVA
jgi:choline kinase